MRHTPLIRFLALLACALPAARAAAQFRVDAKQFGSRNQSIYRWVQVHAENDLDAPMPLEMHISDYGMRNGQSVINLPKTEIPAHSSRTINFAVPMQGWGQFSWTDPVSKVNKNNLPLSNDEAAFLHVSEVGDQAKQGEIEDFGRQYTHWGGGRPVAQVLPGDVPSNWLCFTSMRAVVLPEAVFNTLPPEPKRALLTYCEAGGELVLYKSEKPGTERRLLGKISRVADSPITNLRPPREGWDDARAPWHEGGLEGEFPFRLATEHGTFGGVMLASLFFLTAGPVNLIYVSRKKRPHLLLKTVPLLSFGFCLVMFLYFIFSEGFQRRGGTFALHMLDETTHTGMTRGDHTMLSGLYPHGGFNFPAMAAINPHVREENMDVTMNLEQGQNVSSGWFVPRVPFHYTIWNPIETKEHLLLTTPGKVGNGFEAPIAGGLLVRDGVMFRIPALRRGETAALQPETHDRLDDAVQVFMPKTSQFLFEALDQQDLKLRMPAAQLPDLYIIQFDGAWGEDTTGASLTGPQANVLLGFIKGSAALRTPQES